MKNKKMNKIEATEKDLVVLICFLIKDGNRYNTSEILKKVEKFFYPTDLGIDGIPYNRRTDTALSQKFRNIISHKNKIAFLNLMIISTIDNGKNNNYIWEISDNGKNLLLKEKENFESLNDSSKTYSEILNILKIIRRNNNLN